MGPDDEQEHPPQLPDTTYACLLGLYLGDGWIYRQSNGNFTFMLALDCAYPEIIAEAQRAIADEALVRAGGFEPPTLFRAPAPKAGLSPVAARPLSLNRKAARSRAAQLSRLAA